VQLYVVDMVCRRGGIARVQIYRRSSGGRRGKRWNLGDEGFGGCGGSGPASLLARRTILKVYEPDFRAWGWVRFLDVG
jgi:hypothetical protein